MGSPSRRALVAELDRFDRLLEVGSGDRLGVADSLADRGRDVIAIDVAVDEGAGDDGAREEDGAGAEDGSGEDGGAGDDGGTRRSAGSLRVRHGDVVVLANATDPSSAIGASGGIDAVYARRLPAELHRPTVELARRLDAACLFTTLGFEEPVVPVERRSLPDTTLYVARSSTGPSP